VKRHIELLKTGKKMRSEVRKAEPDFTTTFLRPMPGADRMYPETDVRTIKPDITGLGDVELLEDKAAKLEKMGLAKDLAAKVTKTGRAELVTGLMGKFTDVKPAFIADTLLSYQSELKAKGDPSKISDDNLSSIFSALNEGKIAKESVMAILSDIASGKALDLSRYSLMSDKDIEAEIKKIVEANKDKPEKMLIGIAMSKLKGKADAKKVIEMIKNLV
ncbi:MAG: hypothetical protein KKE20_07425, partial [Nanoarchaeota archaeon]|nr:hypothetical protein [Nanoarchaeota archaeon]